MDIEWKASDNLSLNLDGFYTKLKADNYNRNYMMWASQFVPAARDWPTATSSRTTCSASLLRALPGNGTVPYGVYDQISRPGAASSRTT